MVNPVMLTETGQSYESANIQRWLEVHNTCPVTKKQLTSKQMVPNYALKGSIGQWAERKGLHLPSAPTFKPIIPATTAAAAAAAGVAGTAAAAAGRALVGHGGMGGSLQGSIGVTSGAAWDGMREDGSSSTRWLAYRNQAHMLPPVSAAAAGEAQSDIALLVDGGNKDPSAARASGHRYDSSSLGPAAAGAGRVHWVGNKGAGGGISDVTNSSRSSSKFCTRTSWAVAIIALVIVAAAGAGVGIYLGTKKAQAAGGWQSSALCRTMTTVPSKEAELAVEMCQQSLTMGQQATINRACVVHCKHVLVAIVTGMSIGSAFGENCQQARLDKHTFHAV